MIPDGFAVSNMLWFVLCVYPCGLRSSVFGQYGRVFVYEAE